jgi:hypothetical protein
MKNKILNAITEVAKERLNGLKEMDHGAALKKTALVVGASAVAGPWGAIAALSYLGGQWIQDEDSVRLTQKKLADDFFKLVSKGF